MSDSQFEEQIRKLVPKFVLSQFRHLLPIIPERLRSRFLNLISNGKDMGEALYPILYAKGISHQRLAEYVHHRRQDNMSEILD